MEIIQKSFHQPTIAICSGDFFRDVKSLNTTNKGYNIEMIP